MLLRPKSLFLAKPFMLASFGLKSCIWISLLLAGCSDSGSTLNETNERRVYTVKFTDSGAVYRIFKALKAPVTTEDTVYEYDDLRGTTTATKVETHPTKRWTDNKNIFVKCVDTPNWMVAGYSCEWKITEASESDKAKYNMYTYPIIIAGSSARKLWHALDLPITKKLFRDVERQSKEIYVRQNSGCSGHYRIGCYKNGNEYFCHFDG